MVLMGRYLWRCREAGEGWRACACVGARVGRTLPPPSSRGKTAEPAAEGVGGRSANESHALLPGDLTSQSIPMGVLFIEPLFLALYNLSPPSIS